MGLLEGCGGNFGQGIARTEPQTMTKQHTNVDKTGVVLEKGRKECKELIVCFQPFDPANKSN